jgi:hypothetical protein
MQESNNSLQFMLLSVQLNPQDNVPWKVDRLYLSCTEPEVHCYVDKSFTGSILETDKYGFRTQTMSIFVRSILEVFSYLLLGPKVVLTVIVAACVLLVSYCFTEIPWGVVYFIRNANYKILIFRTYVRRPSLYHLTWMHLLLDTYAVIAYRRG